MIRESLTIQTMVDSGVIDSSSIFQIQECHLESYLRIYHSIFGKTKVGCGKNTNVRFARRLAGRSLLKVNFDRGARFTDIKAGIVYLIENVAFPNYCKVGMTINLKQRLEVYQTYDPYRRFKVRKYDFVLDRCLTEKQILSNSNLFNEQGEWIKTDNADVIFKQITSFIPS